MSSYINELLKDYHRAMNKIFGNSLSSIVLYGSYARGDFNDDSDMDIMILANVPPEKICDYTDSVYEITYDFEMKYNLEINPCVQSIHTFNKWKETYPFYINIEKEGIAV